MLNGQELGSYARRGPGSDSLEEDPEVVALVWHAGQTDRKSRMLP